MRSSPDRDISPTAPLVPAAGRLMTFVACFCRLYRVTAIQRAQPTDRPTPRQTDACPVPSASFSRHCRAAGPRCALRGVVTSHQQSAPQRHRACARRRRRATRSVDSAPLVASDTPNRDKFAEYHTHACSLRYIRRYTTIHQPTGWFVIHCVTSVRKRFTDSRKNVIYVRSVSTDYRHCAHTF